jgi:hypothetical protein
MKEPQVMTCEQMFVNAMLLCILGFGAVCAVVGGYYIGRHAEMRRQRRLTT